MIFFLGLKYDKYIVENGARKISCVLILLLIHNTRFRQKIFTAYDHDCWGNWTTANVKDGVIFLLGIDICLEALGPSRR